MIPALGLVAVLFAARPAVATDLIGPVTHIVDGDTFDMRTPAGTLRTRFCGIDTSERGQPGFDAALTALTRLINKKPVRCVPVGQGTPCDGRSWPTNQDRVVAQCFFGPKDIAEEMAHAGHACD